MIDGSADTVTDPSGVAEDPATHGTAKGGQVAVWDLPTRLFHWSLLVLILSAFCTRNFLSEATLFWHRVNGYAIIALLLFRVMWGLVGSSTSRFASFVPSPASTVRYGLALLRRKPLHYLGHNPLGSLLIFTMLAAVIAQATTGLFTSDDSFAQGPMVDHVSDRLVSKMSAFHAKGFLIIMGLAVIHIAANLMYQFVFKDRLINAMVTGTKAKARYEDQQQARLAPMWRALVCLLVSVTVVIVGLKMMGQNLLR